MIRMIILAKMIVSNSDISKKYKICRDKAESCGKVFVLKNNEPDAVLFSIREYERLSGLIEYMEYLDEDEIANILDLILKEKAKKDYTMGLIRTDVDNVTTADSIKNRI